jgi:hypothetical protein
MDTAEDRLSTGRTIMALLITDLLHFMLGNTGTVPLRRMFTEDLEHAVAAYQSVIRTTLHERMEHLGVSLPQPCGALSATEPSPKRAFATLYGTIRTNWTVRRVASAANVPLRSTKRSFLTHPEVSFTPSEVFFTPLETQTVDARCFPFDGRCSALFPLLSLALQRSYLQRNRILSASLCHLP